MKDKSILLAASLLMGFAALLHVFRVFAGWDLVIETWIAPVWLSIITFLIAGFLSYKVFVISKKTR